LTPPTANTETPFIRLTNSQTVFALETVDLPSLDA
jgi:hypothetical protein